MFPLATCSTRSHRLVRGLSRLSGTLGGPLSTVEHQSRPRGTREGRGGLSSTRKGGVAKAHRHEHTVVRQSTRSAALFQGVYLVSSERVAPPTIVHSFPEG